MAQFKSISTKVIIEGLLVPTWIGLHQPERSEQQNILIDVSCLLREPGVPGEKLARSVDYVPIVRAIKAIASERKRRLIETFAHEIAEICFESGNVESVTVSIRKPHKIPQVSAVGVTRVFERDERS